MESYYLSIDPSVTTTFAVSRLSHERFAPGYRIDRVERPNSVLLFVASGRGWYRGECGRVELEPNMAFSFAPGIRHTVVSDRGEPLEVRRVVMIGADAPVLIRTYGGHACHAWRLSSPAEVNEILWRMFQLVREGQPHASHSCDLYARLLLLALGRSVHVCKHRHSQSSSTFGAARRIMNAEFSTGISVVDVARRVGVSYEYITRLFRTFQGVSPGEYLRRLRMNKASELLGEGYKVSAVYHEVGYADIYAFSKAFKRVFGVPPSRWA